MKNFFTLFLSGAIMSLIISSAALANVSNKVNEFNFGAGDADSNCENIRATLKSRIDNFSKIEKVQSRNFLFWVDVVQRRRVGIKGSYSACVARIESNYPNYVFAENEESKRFGQARDVTCEEDGALYLRNNVNAIGIRTNFNQGWILNPFCRTFELVIEKI